MRDKGKVTTFWGFGDTILDHLSTNPNILW